MGLGQPLTKRPPHGVEHGFGQGPLSELLLNVVRVSLDAFLDVIGGDGGLLLLGGGVPVKPPAGLYLEFGSLVHFWPLGAQGCTTCWLGHVPSLCAGKWTYVSARDGPGSPQHRCGTEGTSTWRGDGRTGRNGTDRLAITLRICPDKVRR